MIRESKKIIGVLRIPKNFLDMSRTFPGNVSEMSEIVWTCPGNVFEGKRNTKMLPKRKINIQMPP